ncbi:protein-tyrosine phosphatase-like protein [Mycena latifolia]|nr:protein-tyrosine phosphatase-like protein [Mycena latifolia]
MGITHILSVMPPELAPTPANEGDGFTRMSIPVQDWPDEELFTHFKATNAFIDHARKTSGEGVLVHCLQGVSRSATIVAAYLMASHPPIHDSVSAIEFLQAQRSIVQPNWGFLEQLALYGRCGCNLEDNPVAVEAWRAGRTRRWEVNKEKRQPLGMWSRMSRWAASLFP